MSSSNMEVKKRPKKFEFKKRAKPLSLSDDDDDDFKPVKESKSNSLSVHVREKSNLTKTDTTSKGHAAVVSAEVLQATAGFFSSGHVTPQNGNAPILPKSVPDSASKKVELYCDILSDNEWDQQADEDIVVVASFPNSTNIPANDSKNADGKSQWKSLVSKMQINQKAATTKLIANKSSTNTKRAKLAVKRNFVHSPKKEKGVSRTALTHSAVRSPLSKAPRLGMATTSRRSMQGTLNKNNTPGTSSTTGNKEISLSSISNALKQDCTGSQSQMPTSSTKITKIAPIFLPAAERNMVQNSKVVECDKIVSGFLLESIVDSESQDQNFIENSKHFNGNTVLLNLDQPKESAWGANKTKPCPFYKKLPGVPFCVDAFNYGVIPDMEVYFLSHFHSDHYIGLTKKFPKTIICSYPTGNLVTMKLYVEEKCIRKLFMNKAYIICDTEVTLIDANHCPGSVMFIFRLNNGEVILHTGDFRYIPSMLKKPSILADIQQVDTVYLDTTYCSPQYNFPTQQEAISNVVVQVKRHLENRPRTLILCGSYLIGKERVYFTLAEAIGSKVFGSYDKRKIIYALGNSKFSSLLAADETDVNANVHVVSMFTINPKNLQEYLVKRPQYTNIIGIKPSGWQFSGSGSGCSIKTHYNASVTVIGVAYSEHSSFSELKALITNLKPKRVQPTVNVGSAKKRGEMMHHIGNWLDT